MKNGCVKLATEKNFSYGALLADTASTLADIDNAGMFIVETSTT